MAITDFERVTVRLPKDDVAELADRVDDGEFPNRSEAIRDAVSQLLDESTDRRRQQALADGGQRNADGSEYSRWGTTGRGVTSTCGASDSSIKDVNPQVFVGYREFTTSDRQDGGSA